MARSPRRNGAAMRRRPADHDLVYDLPAPEWSVGAPLGNGHIGVMLWGDGAPLHLTFDRDDLWDLRPMPAAEPSFTWATLRELVRQGRMDEVNTLVERNLNPRSMTPTKLPLGRLEVRLADGAAGFSGRLSLEDATFRGRIGASRIEVCVAAELPFVILRVQGSTKLPAVAWRSLAELNPTEAAKIDLAAPASFADGRDRWVVQDFPAGGAAVVAWRLVRRGENATLLATIAATTDGPDPVALARDRLASGARQVVRILASHADWWRAFWDRSGVSLPDGELETLWYYGLYKLASSSQPGHLPANLQGLWVTDGVLPPWRGDYHCNMNVQETYWPVYASNHLELGLPLYDWLARIAPAVRERTRRFFGWDGIRLETAIVADGTPVPGWGTVQYWPAAAAWMAHHLWLHWLYSGDLTFLRERAYPFMRLCMAFWEGYLEEGPDGRLHVPLSHSPEWHGNHPSAWGRDPVIDLSLVRNLVGWLVEASEVLGVDAKARTRWVSVRERLAPYPLDEHGGLMLMDGVPLAETHRHPSHLMPVFPMHDLSIEGDEQERRTIARSIERLEWCGTGEWTGWSFPYASLIASRVGRGEMAAYMLRLYVDSFVLPNGCHVNGDWRKHGISTYHYRAYTMEAECAAAAAVTEMLLQSWGGRIRLFPAVPTEWRDVAFTSLRAEGAVLVSATRQGGRTTRAELSCDQDREVLVAGLPEDARWEHASSALWADGAWRVGLRGGRAASATATATPHARADESRRPRARSIFGFRGWDA